MRLRILTCGLLWLWTGAGPAAAADLLAYSLQPLTNGLALRQTYTPTQRALLEKLNRADQKHLARQRQIVVPSLWDLDELAYSPLPADYPAAVPLAKALVVEQAHQVFGAYEHGRLVRWGPVSTGRKASPTPPGLFFLNWHSKGRHSTVDPEWFMSWYFNFDNRRGLSMHQYELPGLPESHACVRLLERDARWVYAWGEGWELDADAGRVVKNGTPLWILGTYDHAASKPWLSESPPTITLPEAAPWAPAAQGSLPE